MKKAISSALYAIGFFMSLTGVGFACDFCLLSQGISPLETFRGSGIRINERYTRLNSVYKGTDEIANPGAKEEYWTTEFTGFYGVTEDIMLLAVLPLKNTRQNAHLHVHEDGDLEAHGDMKGGETGLGDVAALGRYTFFKNHTLDATTILAGVFGVKFPTGGTEGKTDDGAEYLDSHLQTGTGSTDFLLGLSSSYALARFSLSANILAALTTEGEAGDTRHRFGNSINYDVTAMYRVHPFELAPTISQVFLAFGLNGETRQREKENGVALADSGGSTIYLSPAVRLALPPRWIAEIQYQHPIYHNLYGVQMGEDYRLVGGVTYLF